MSRIGSRMSVLFPMFIQIRFWMLFLFSCLCTPGWQGVHCTRRTVDCLGSGSQELCGHGTCVQTSDSTGYRCICDQGWKSLITPACTVDVDECADSKPHCSMEPVVTCLNLPGTYMCGPCPHGNYLNKHQILNYEIANKIDGKQL